MPPLLLPRQTSRCATAAAVLALLASTAVTQAQTIEIPRDQVEDLQQDIEDIQDMDISIDFSSPNAMMRTFEEFGSSDMVESYGMGWHRDVVWEMTISGSWDDTITGDGELTHWRLGDTGAMLHALLRDEQREAPLIIGVSAPEVIGRHIDGGGSEVGIGTIDNHFFESDRILGHVHDSDRMDAPGFQPLEDMVDEFDETQFRNAVVDVVEAGEDEDGALSWHMRWTATLVEEDQFGNPTGRLANVRGWLCDAASHEDDPDACRGDFELVSHLPTEDHTNVNPETPGLILTFSEPADIESLDENTIVYTQDSGGDQLPIPGQWHREDEGVYHFENHDALHSGTTYRVEISGGEDGVVSDRSRHPLEEDIAWDFSTLVDLPAQAVGADGPSPLDMLAVQAASTNPIEPGEPIGVRVFQTIEEPELTIHKPAMTRLWVDWEPHDDIAPSWQPETFEMTVQHSPSERRVQSIGRNTVVSDSAGRSTIQIRPQETFDADDRRNAANTVNLLGWSPDAAFDGVTIRLEPAAPYPEPLESAVVEHDHEVELWDHNPGFHNLYYVFLEDDDLDTQLAKQGFEEYGEYVFQFMPYRGGSAQPLTDPVSRDELRSREISREMIATTGRRDVIFNDPFSAITSEYQPGETPGTRRILRMAALIRALQREHAELLAPDDTVALVVSGGTLADGAVASSIIHGAWDNARYRGTHPYRAGAIVISTHDALDAELFATTVIHEIGHDMGLEHWPGHSDEVGNLSDEKDSSISGWRMALTGVDGWNKSSIDGNQEKPGILATPMWPKLFRAEDVMMRDFQYETLQVSIADGYLPAEQETGWLRQSAVTYAGLGDPPPAETGDKSVFVLRGLLSWDRDRMLIDYAGLSDAPGATGGDGPLIAELLDSDGVTLTSAGFDGATMEPDILLDAIADRGFDLRAEIDDPRDLGWLLWPEFRVSLRPDPAARQLRIRHDDTVLIETALPADVPAITDAEARIRDDDVHITWDVDADARNTGANTAYTLRYSPNAGQEWRFLARADADETSLTIPVDQFRRGDGPMIEIEAQAGVHRTRKTLDIPDFADDT